jgi:hypothetical protein
MQRRVWSLEELTRILLATDSANGNADAMLSSGMLSAENQMVVQAYREGFKAALGSIAMAIGVPLSRVTAPRWRGEGESPAEFPIRREA